MNRRRYRRRLQLALFLAPVVASGSFFIGERVLAQTAPNPGGSSRGNIGAACVETIPSGVGRPEMTDVFPEDGISGYVSNLEITIKHGKGETVLPNGFRVDASGEAARAFAGSGFALPDVDGGAGPVATTKNEGDHAITKVTIPILALPPKAGRVQMTLPPLPITISRANKEVIVLCTAEHGFTAEDPVASENDPQVRPNPTLRHEKVFWYTLFYILLGILGAAILGVAIWFFVQRQRRKPKAEKVEARRVPWVLALEELDAIRASKLLSEGKKAEYFDRMSDAIRKYLGARYGFEGLGFDGLDTTTDEMRALLRRVKPPITNLDGIGLFLDDCDLVKFASLVPSEEDCKATLTRGENIVRATMPAAKGSVDGRTPPPPNVTPAQPARAAEGASPLATPPPSAAAEAPIPSADAPPAAQPPATPAPPDGGSS